MPIIKQLTIAVIILCCYFQFILAADASTLLSQAMENFQQKRFQAAAELFAQVIKTEPANAQAYYYLGATLEQLKDPDNAKKMYEACFKLNPFSDQGRQAANALTNLIEKQAAIAHPYDEPNVVDTSVRNINQQVNHLQQDKMNYAAAESAYQLQRGDYRAYRLGLRANQAYYDYPRAGATANEVSNLALIRSYDALAYAQRESTHILTNGYQAASYARESGNNLINSFNEPPFKPDEPQLRAAGTDLYIRNYSYTDNDNVPPADPITGLKATAGRLETHALNNKIGAKN